MTSLPTKPQGRPVLLGQVLDADVQGYVRSQRAVGGVINTAIVRAGAEGIILARDRSVLVKYGGHIELTKAWAMSLLHRMGYSKRRCSNAGKVSLPHLEEIQKNFLANIQSEVAMNDIPSVLVFNWDQTALRLIPTGQWTMHPTGAKVVPIAHCDDKRQVTAVLAATLTGEFLPPQIIYEGKTERCHPKGSVPDGWDIWHSSNHWSNEDTMVRYVEKVIVPFLDENRAEMNLEKTHPALALFDCFRGQVTPEFYSLIEKHNIIPVLVPANCMDKLQPMDVSVNKPVKDHIKQSFHSWYAEEVQSQLQSSVPVHEVKVDVRASIIKAKSINRFISAWESIKKRPDIGI